LLARWRCSTFDGHPNESGRDTASETKVDEVVGGMSKRTTLVLNLMKADTIVEESTGISWRRTATQRDCGLETTLVESASALGTCTCST
jgi:hypothetical protein